MRLHSLPLVLQDYPVAYFFALREMEEDQNMHEASEKAELASR